MVSPRAWLGGAILALALGGTAAAQVDYDAIRSGVAGCPELASDPEVGDLAALLCRPQDRTSLDLPISTQSKFFEVRAGSFAVDQRAALLGLVRGAIGESEYARLRALLFAGQVPTAGQETRRRDLLVQAADPATPPAQAALLRALADSIVAGSFDTSLAALLAARVDRDRLADLRSGGLRSLGARDVVSSFETGLASSLTGLLQVSGVPFATDADGNDLTTAFAMRPVLPFWIGGDGQAGTSDDLPYLRDNAAAQAAGYALAPPLPGRFSQTFLGIPIYSATAQRDVDSLDSPGTPKTVEVYAVFNRTHLVRIGCNAVGGAFEPSSGRCLEGLIDVSAAAASAGCTASASTTLPSAVVGTNLDAECIELAASASGPNLVAIEALDLLADPVLRPASAALDPVDLTDLALRAQGGVPIAARPLSPSGNVGFPVLPATFARSVDPTTGAPVESGGAECRVRTNASAVAIGPNGVAGDGDDVLPSAGDCLLWGEPDGAGVQRLLPSFAVAAGASSNQSLFRTLCTLSFDGDAGRCELDAFNRPTDMGALNASLGGLGFSASTLLSGIETIRTSSASVQRRGNATVGAVQVLAINPLGPMGLDAQDIGFVAEPAQAALFGCGAGFASPCSNTQRRLWDQNAALRASLGRVGTGGIDLLNTAGDVLVQDFATVKVLRAEALVGATPSVGGELAFLPGMNWSRNGTTSNRPGPSGTVRVENGAYLALTPQQVIDLGPEGRASFQQGPPNKVQADGWVEPMPWALDPDALVQFGAIVFQSDPTDPIAGPANVFVSGGEYCGRWMNPNPSASATPFNQTCTLLETVSANLERLRVTHEILGQDRLFDPPETVAELVAMLDGDSANDALGDPISGPDGIFARNERVFRADAMDFEVVEATNQALLGTAQLDIPDSPEVGLDFLLGYDPNERCGRDLCFLQVNDQLADPGDATSENPLVVALPIGTAVDRIEGGVEVAVEKVNLARLAWSAPHALASLLAGNVVDVDGRLLQLDLDQRRLLLGVRGDQNERGLDLDGDGTTDLDRDRDGVFDGADDFSPGPIADDAVLCGSGIPGDLLQDGLQFEPWSDADAPGSAAFDAALPIGLAPRSPVFCRSLNALLALLGPGEGESDAFLWHGGAPAPGTDPDADGWPSAVDGCPSVADPGQEDGDGDGVGDVCDSCVEFPNPRVPAGFLDANPWATLTGGQRDDDGDGYGNLCDAKFTSVPVPSVGTHDLAQFRASMGAHVANDTCGTSGAAPCAIFDLDEQSPAIDTNDLARFRELQGWQPGPRCPSCPLACEAGADGACD